MNSKKGLLLVFASAVLLSIGGLCVKKIPWNPLSINAFRSILSVGILLVFAKLSHHPFRWNAGVLVGALGVCGATVLYTVATKLTTAGNAVLLQFTAPIFVILFSWALFHERPQRRDVVASVFILGGIFCFFLDSLGSGRLVGDVIGVLSGLCYAWFFLHKKLPGGDPVWATVLGQGMGALIGLPFLVQETQFDGTTLFYAVILGVFQLGLAYVCLTAGIQYVKPITAVLASGIQPVLNPILVAVVVGETLSRWSLLGGAVVFVSIMVYNVLSVKAEKEEEEDRHVGHPVSR